MESFRQLYENEIILISHGDMTCEPKARELAEEQGYPTDDLEKAVEEGHRQEYERKISFVSSGDMTSEQEARELAEEYGYPTDDLEKAVEEGKSK